MSISVACVWRKPCNLIFKPLVIFGDGEQTRDFAYVKDVVVANTLAARSEAERIYNISSGKSITANNLAGRIIKLTGDKSSIIYEKPWPGGNS